MISSMGTESEPLPPHQLTLDSSTAPPPPATESSLTTAAAAPEANGHVKRKRGRPPKSASATASAPVAKKSKNEEEDVCFICFDGGSLVLCDRRDCPKAYHPACVKRDESFFSSRLRWNCGWHLCNSCQRNALFMCYTCPYSLCKACVKQADISCVRGNKGFCKTCMSTISLIENINQGSDEVVKVDFDDVTSWEYLFKVYWVLLKQNESLTLDELTRATNPWKGLTTNHVNNHVEPSMPIAPLETCNVPVEANVSKRRKTRKQPPVHNNSCERIPTYKLHESVVDWASKELLEFVAYVKNGDTSKLTKFDVQALLLDYIRKNKLRDSRRNSEITCDKRLEILFGKARLGHFEMLELLEYHLKDGSGASSNSVVRASAIDSSVSQMKLEECSDESNIVARERKRKTQKKVDEREGQIKLDNFAAIDVHNMSLIYLRRNLMENLLEDAESFHDKVVGSIVRIRICDNDLKQEMYRLVQVVGTCKVAEPYKSGDKTAPFILRILNLDKIQDVKIDAISNQDLSEDECIRLRENIKCGLVERMTVGEVKKKAIALQEVRVKDVLDAEILKLNHLRDRARELGHRKELREYAEKLELLKSPEERRSRMHETPEVHVDPRMDPMYQSDEDSEQSANKEDVSLTPVHSISNSSVELIARSSSSNCDLKRNVSDRSQISKEDDAARSLESSQSTLELEKNAARILEELKNQVNPCRIASKHEATKLVNHPMDASDASVTSCSQSVLSPNDPELEKIWHYEDPSHRVQGPFCMLQLRKWNSEGYFPTDLRIWRIDESQAKSVLLSEAMLNPCNSERRFQSDCLESSQEARFVSDCKNPEQGGQLNININATWTNDKPSDGCNSDLIDAVRCSDDPRQSITGQNSGQEADLHSKSQVSPVENHKSCHVVSSSGGEVSNACLASTTDTVFRTVDQNHKPEYSDLPSLTSILSSEGSKYLDVELNPGMPSSGLELPNPPSSTIKLEPVHENFKGQAEENKVTVDLKCEAEEHIQPVSSIDLEQYRHPPNQTPELNNDMTKSQVTEFKEPVASYSHVQEFKEPAPSYSHGQEPFTSWHTFSSGIGFSVPVSSANQKTEGVVKGLATELCLSSNVACQDIGFSWNSAAPLAGETGQQWVGYSMPPKSCVVDLDSGMKFSDHATTTTGACQFTNSLTTQFDCNTSGWHDGLIELSTLGDESVSDLLSEVEAMESMHGLPSPNSRILFGDDSLESLGNDCFSPLGGLNLPLDTGRHDTWSTATCDLQFRHQPTVTDPQPPYSFNLQDCPTKDDIRAKQQDFASSSQQDFLSLTCASLLSPEPASAHGHPPTSLSLCTMDSRGGHKMDIQEKLHDISNSLNIEFVSLLNNPEPSLPSARSPDPNQAHIAAKRDELPSQVNLPPAPTPSRMEISTPTEPGQTKLGYVSRIQKRPVLHVDVAPSSTLDTPASPVEEGEVDPTSLSLELSVNSPASRHSPRNQISQSRVCRKISSFGEEGKAKPTPNSSSDALTSTGRGTSVRETTTVFPSTGGLLSPKDAIPIWAISPGTATTGRSNQVNRASQQPRYPGGGGGRHSGQSDRSYHQNVDPGFVKGARPSWQRQTSFNSNGSGGGGGYSRQSSSSHRGARVVCKFYESGHCKKGASCTYLHP